MKKNSYILACLLAIAGLICTASAQTKKIPPPDKDILYDKEPVVVKRVDPVYPESMLHGGWEATVYLKVCIDMNGDVIESKSEKIQVTSVKEDNKDDKSFKQKTDGKAFVEAANSAVKQWKFSPAQMQGKPVTVWITVPFRFKLTGEKKTPGSDADNAEIKKSVDMIGTIIENILKGKETEKTKRFVSINASLIYKTEIVNLYSVINGENKHIHLTEDKDSKCINMNVNIGDGHSSAIVLWKSKYAQGKKERIHSITLSRTSSNEWQITHWHVSW
jgi:hypothetical protein